MSLAYLDVSVPYYYSSSLTNTVRYCIFIWVQHLPVFQYPIEGQGQILIFNLLYQGSSHWLTVNIALAHQHLQLGYLNFMWVKHLQVFQYLIKGQGHISILYLRFQGQNLKINDVTAQALKQNLTFNIGVFTLTYHHPCLNVQTFILRAISLRFIQFIHSISVQ